MKFGGWLMMITGMVLFLTFIGLPTSFTLILNTLGITNIESGISFQLSSFYTIIIGALTVIATGGVIIGFFSKGYDTSQVIAPVVVLLAGVFIPSFIIIINYVALRGIFWMTSIVTVLFVTLAVGFIMSALDYFGNR